MIRTNILSKTLLFQQQREDIINDKINATSPYNDGWTQEFYKDKLKERGITTTEINIAVPDHPDYTEL